MKKIRWSYPSVPQVKGGQYVGLAWHGQYWRGHEGDPSGATWFAVYKPTDGLPELLIENATAGAMYTKCTEDNDAKQEHENICWTKLEPRDANGDCAAIGTWQGHVYSCLRLADGSWASTHQFQGGAVTVLATGVQGRKAWRAARDHCTEQQLS